MNRSFSNVLRRLANSPDQWVSGYALPNGHGHTHPRGASGETLRKMKDAGLIEYGKEPTHSLSGWKITDAGISAIGSPAKGEME